MKKLSVAASFADTRGEIVDLLENENINAITVITFTPGAVRANHYHKQTTQWNYLLEGRVRMVSSTPDGKRHEAILEPGDFVVTEPNVAHALEALTAAKLMVFTKGPRGGKEYESDTYRLDTPLITPRDSH